MLKRLLALKGIHFFVTRFGSQKMRSLAFDAKYRRGDWCFRSEARGELPEVVRYYLRKGDLLVMGCGEASVLDGLEATGLSTALGVDLSEEAINLAKRYESAKVSFALADMESFICPRAYDVILFSESINYVSSSNLETFLSNLSKNLKAGGVFIITIAQAKRYHGILHKCRQLFTVLEDRTFVGSTRHLLVLSVK